MSDKCAACGKTVFAMEALRIEKLVFHKTGCFKCCHCGGALKAGNYASLAGRFYCKPHFKQLFALKGNYSEGFGEKKPTQQWAEGHATAAADTEPPTAAPATAPEVPVPTPVPAPAPAPAPAEVATTTAAAAPQATTPVQTPVVAVALKPASERQMARGDTAARLNGLRLSGLTIEDVERAQAKMREFDADGNGIIDRTEFAEIIRQLHPTKGEIFRKRLTDMLFKGYDTNASDGIDEIEFLRVYSELLASHDTAAH